MRGGGSQSATNFVMRSHVNPPFWLRRRLWRSLHRVVAVPVSIGLAILMVILHASPRARARAIPDGKCAVEWKLFRFGRGSATSLSRSPKVELIAGALPQ